MIVWPESLPGPNKTSNVNAGSNITCQQWASGRIETRRFGSGAPDKIPVQFKLRSPDANKFEDFFTRDLNLGINWFTAPWLIPMGYSNHGARILGHPKRKGKTGQWTWYSVSLLVQDENNIPGDILWSGSGPGSNTAAEGLVIAWGHEDHPVVSNCPLDLEAVKVVASGNSSHPFAAALKRDGSLYCWGDTSEITGWEALGNIKDITATYGGFIFLTFAGVLGFHGEKYGGEDGVPSITDGLAVYSANSGTSWGLVTRENGDIQLWGWKNETISGLGEIHHVTNGGEGMAVVSGNPKEARVWVSYEDGNAGQSSMPAFTSPPVIAASHRYVSLAQSQDGTWTFWGDNKSEISSPPPGLRAKQLLAGRAGVIAIHSDGSVVLWGRVKVLNFPAGLKAHQLNVSHMSAANVEEHFGVAIKMEEI